MRFHICAVGRLRHGPEKTLIDDYRGRFDKIGRSMAMGPLDFHEVEDKKGGGPRAEAVLLNNVIPKNSLICTLDERGKLMSSPQFANLLAQYMLDAVIHIGADHLTSSDSLTLPIVYPCQALKPIVPPIADLAHLEQEVIVEFPTTFSPELIGLE